MNRRPFFALAAGLALLIAESASAQPGPPVKIGGITFLTGKFASYGADYSGGMKLGVEYVNRHGGVLGGRKLELDLQDTGSDSAQAATILRRMAANDDIVGVVGPTGTPDFLAVMPIAKSLRIPMLVGGSAPITHDQFPDTVVRPYMVENPQLMTSLFAKVKAARGISRVALVTDRTNDAQQVARRNALEGVKGTGVEVVADEYVRTGDRDFAAVIDKMLTSRPDAIMLSATTNEVSLFLTQARARGFKGLFMGTSGLSDPKIGELAKESAVGAVTVLPFDAQADVPVVKEFAAAYMAANGNKPPSTFAAYTFDDVLLLVNAINKAGTTDRAKVMQALGQTKGFQGVTSKFTFVGKGDNATQSPYTVEFAPNGGFRAFK